MKRFVLGVALLLGMVAFATPASAGLFFYPGQTNEIVYQNWENLFDSAGNVKSVVSAPAVGDHLAGIFQVNRIIDHR